MNENMEWKNMGATDAQIKMIQNLLDGKKISGELLKATTGKELYELTKGEASEVISFFKEDIDPVANLAKLKFSANNIQREGNKKTVTDITDVPYDVEKRQNDIDTVSGNSVYDLVKKWGGDWTPEEIKLIKSMFASGSTDAEFMLFLRTALRMDLDPMLKEIWCVKRSPNDSAVIMVSHQGLLKKVLQSGLLDGLETSIYYSDGTTVRPKDGVPVYAECTVYRKNMSHPTIIKVYYDTFVQKTRDGRVNHFWASMPEIMLGKVAEATALRKAFADVLGTVYVPEEIADNGVM